MSNNFNHWYNEIADMPQKDDQGRWVDLETGLFFESSVHYKTGGKVTRWEPSKDIKGYRAVAKFYGGKALTGSSKQKEWAESIRAKWLELDNISDEQKAEFLALQGATGTAKFWINNKGALSKVNKSTLIKCDEELRALIEQHNELRYENSSTGELDQSRVKIYKALKEMPLSIGYVYQYDFEYFDVFGNLLDMEEVNGRLREKKKSWRR